MCQGVATFFPKSALKKSTNKVFYKGGEERRGEERSGKEGKQGNGKVMSI